MTLPLFVTALSTVRSVAWLMTRSLPAPVTLAERILNVAFVGSKAPSAVQSSPLDVMAPVPVIEPFATLSTTLPAPALATVVPVRVRLPLATVSDTSPAALMPAGSTTRPFDSLTVRLPLVMLAVRLLALVLSVVLFFAVTVRTFPAICPAELFSVRLPWLAVSATLPVPAEMVPVPVRLPVVTLTLIAPFTVDRPLESS